MYERARTIFWMILGAYVLTLSTVTYVGVYLTYIVFPILVVLGLIMIFTPSKAVNETQHKKNESPLEQTLDTVNKGIDSLSDFLEVCDYELKKLEDHAKEFNGKNKLLHEDRMKNLDDEYNRLTPEQKKIFDSIK